MIPKTELKGKHICFLDRDGKYRIGRVLKVNGSNVTVRTADKCKRRVHRERIFGRQLRKEMEEISW